MDDLVGLAEVDRADEQRVRGCATGHPDSLAAEIFDFGFAADARTPSAQVS
jgi:hypothetical protein